MNEDKPAARTDITEQAPSLVEKIGTHSLGATAGVIGGAVTGALVGVAAGPVGSVLGAVGGALLGGALGASTTVGPRIDLSQEDRYWCEHYATRPYVPGGAVYADWGPAYRHGARACLSAAQPRDWHAVEAELAQQWPSCNEDSRLAWEEALPAVRDAWERVDAARK
jgi:hypothetical protein